LKLAPIAPRRDEGWMREEVARLESAALVPHDRYLVAAAGAAQIPALLREIGRLREITFRSAGEGTGRELDLDLFDRTYEHLFVWDRQAGELVGAYRLGETERLRPVFGAAGLYTHSLFELDDAFFAALGPAIELGRSFVRAEYQRSAGALMLLWKGIGQLVLARPKVKMLFGAVSVSAGYSPASRALIAASLSHHYGEPALAAHVRPRRPLRPGWRARRKARMAAASAPERLSQLVAAEEPDSKGLPVLVREYLKLGGRFLAWNVDPAFAGVLDGLVVVNLARTSPRLLEFYMGGQAADFLAAHAGT
jgi:putative hemolysin